MTFHQGGMAGKGVDVRGFSVEEWGVGSASVLQCLGVHDEIIGKEVVVFRQA